MSILFKSAVIQEEVMLTPCQEFLDFLAAILYPFPERRRFAELLVELTVADR